MDFEVFDRRTVQLSGPLDEAKALQVSAELMLLDGTGDEAIQLMVDSAGGTIDGALMLIDVLSEFWALSIVNWLADRPAFWKASVRRGWSKDT